MSKITYYSKYLKGIFALILITLLHVFFNFRTSLSSYVGCYRPSFLLGYCTSLVIGVYLHLVLPSVGYRRDVVRFNLKTAFPEMDKATLKETEKRFYHHFCDLFIEVIKTLSISEQTLRDRYLFTNIEVLQKYVR